MTAGAWPDVPVDKYGGMTCPMPLCTEDLVLTRTYAIPLTAEQAAHDDHVVGAAVSDHWQVECHGGHVLVDHVDQIRASNAALIEHDDYLDETGDTAPAYDHMFVHERIHALWSAVER